MFTGLVEDVGRCVLLENVGESVHLTVASSELAPQLHKGDSVSTNGCCLTVSSLTAEEITFDLLQETLSKTNLRHLKPGQPVNLERAMPADGRFGGHIVQGHIDCTCRLVDIHTKQTDLGLEFALSAEFAKFIVSKGSVAINGVSLTVADHSEKSFVVWIIPHTRSHTNLGELAREDEANIEFDIVAKYVARLMPDSLV